MNILFICTGNVSRSFLAEMLLKQSMAGQQGPPAQVQSAGLFTNLGAGPDPVMVRYLEDRNIAYDQHASQAVTPDLLDWADLVLVMEKFHLDMLVDINPDSKKKIQFLGRYLPGNQQEDEIRDPFGKSAFHYRLAQSQIALAIKALAASLLKGKIK